MKHVIFTLALFFSLTGTMFGVPKYQNWCMQGGQQVVVGGVPAPTKVQKTYGIGASPCTITVFVSGTGGTVKATLYSNESLTPLANPFFNQNSTTGQYFFYVGNGQYDVQIQASGLTTYTLSDQFVSDVTSALTGTLTLNTVPKQGPTAGVLVDSSVHSGVSLGGPGTGTFINDKTLIGASTATSTDDTSGTLFVRGGITSANNGTNANLIRLQALSDGSYVLSDRTGTATIKPLVLGTVDPTLGVMKGISITDDPIIQFTTSYTGSNRCASGTAGLRNNAGVLEFCNNAGAWTAVGGGGGGSITGSGTATFLPVFTGPTAIGNSTISRSNLGGPGTGLLLHDKVLVAASTTTTDALNGSLIVDNGITLVNNAANANALSFQALSSESDVFSTVTGTATVKPLALGLNDSGGPIPNIKMFPGSIINGSTGGNQMVWNPPFSGFANTIDVGLFSTPEQFDGTKFLVQVYTTGVDSTKAHTAIDGSLLYRLTNGSSGVAAGVLGHVAVDPNTGTPVTSSIGIVGAAGFSYTLIQPGNAPVNMTNNVIGMNGRVTQYSAGTMSYAYAGNTNGPVTAGSGTIDNAYGFAILDVGLNLATGHTNHAVGLWIEPITNGIVDNYAIKSDGGNSYHVGNFRFGDNSAPTATVDIAGSAIISDTGVTVLQVKSATSTTNIGFTTNTSTTPVVVGDIQGSRSGTGRFVNLFAVDAGGFSQSALTVAYAPSTGGSYIGMAPGAATGAGGNITSSGGTYAFFVNGLDGKLYIMGPSNTITGPIAVP